MKDIRAFIGDEMEARMAQARRRAEWEIGDGSWADVILAAFLDPEADAEALDMDKG